MYFRQGGGCVGMIRKIEHYWSELVEQVLADPKLTQAEAEFLETVPDLFEQRRRFLDPHRNGGEGFDPARLVSVDDDSAADFSLTRRFSYLFVEIAVGPAQRRQDRDGEGGDALSIFATRRGLFGGRAF